MNDSPDPRARLLAETLHGDWCDGPMAAIARRAAAHARWRRRVRRGSLALTTAAVLGAAVFLIPRHSPPLSSTLVPIVPRGYEIISDDELLARLRDRPLLVLPRENGTKTVMLLGR